MGLLIAGGGREGLEANFTHLKNEAKTQHTGIASNLAYFDNRALGQHAEWPSFYMTAPIHDRAFHRLRRFHYSTGAIATYSYVRSTQCRFFG